MAITTTPEERKPPSTVDDSSRKLFQRLWTNEDEIGLLQRFLEYNTKQRGTSKKDLIFKTSHDQSCFEISKKIWGGETGGNVVSGGGVDEEDGSPNPLHIVEVNKVDVGSNNKGVGANINGSEKKATTMSRRIRKRTEEPPSVSNPLNLSNLSVSSVIEETVKSCLSPLFKELLQSAINGPNNVRGLGMMGNLVTFIYCEV
ncbi:hypothetical protein MKX01_008997 [Papaver californicum]|nr:hypothetical protein MKX01_008997 [Papaver californicum]